METQHWCLQDVVFMHNPYQDLWYAFHREDWNAYWNKKESSKYEMRTASDADKLVDRVVASCGLKLKVALVNELS